MPIYEFYCRGNHKIYTFFARSLSYAGKTPRCPDNPKLKMERLISSFAVTGRAKEKSEDGNRAPVDDAKMESLMAEMQQELGGSWEPGGSDDNAIDPDPRKLARMMQKMSEVTGEPFPAGMQEMMKRMEAGEDPEKLEATYADAFDEFDSGVGAGGPGAKNVLAALARRRSRPPLRDPVMYEMADYLFG